MSSQRDWRVTFRGAVSCRRDATGPLGLTLIGRTTDHAEDEASLAFSGLAPESLPEVLADPIVERVGTGRYRIASASREWVVEASAAHLHTDVGTAFYRAIPPRMAPWKRRALWRLLLALAATSLGKRLLLALRR